MSEGINLLVGSVGKDKGDEIRYELGDEESRKTYFAPVALADLLDIDSALIPRTEMGSEHDDYLRAEFEQRDVDCRFEDIPNFERRADADEILGTIIEAVRDIGPSTVTLDITHGFRSLPMVFFVTTGYLTALEEIDLAGIYYGKYPPEKERGRVIDLTYFYTLLEWYHALRTFEATGSLRPAHVRLEEMSSEFTPDERPAELETALTHLSETAQYVDSGMPLDGGMAAAETVDALADVEESDFVGPEEALFPPLQRQLQAFVPEQETSQKAMVELTTTELDRHRALVDFYRAADRYRVALQVARELIINRVLYESRPQHRKHWLDPDERLWAARQLERLPEDADIKQLWTELNEYRERYDRSGFVEDAPPSEADVDRCLEAIAASIDEDSQWAEL